MKEGIQWHRFLANLSPPMLLTLSFLPVYKAHCIR